ncbi:hypothetical protein QFZ31_006718 [Neobacillus niacini]|uniref:hypothetical protein n=1 Tax=Neobacillus driksii TaxID=3035913 RepID=UPI00277E364C|nr:hypothetical protein [Neobacillus niacini]MDQ0976666.1 hypothetical protein [Neobacillus niacini]
MNKVFEVLLFLIIVIGCIGLIVSWFYGVPALAHMIYEPISYAVYLSIWLSIHLVRNMIGRIKAQNQLKQYQEIHKILGGK